MLAKEVGVPFFSREIQTPMVFISLMSEATKWLMHVIQSLHDPLTPLQYSREISHAC